MSAQDAWIKDTLALLAEVDAKMHIGKDKVTHGTELVLRGVDRASRHLARIHSA
jgi:hypothetical protein